MKLPSHCLNQLFVQNDGKDCQRSLSVVPGIAWSPYGDSMRFQEEPQYVRPRYSFRNIYSRCLCAETQHILAIFFDLEKAYDTTRHGIRSDLRDLGFRGLSSHYYWWVSIRPTFLLTILPCVFGAGRYKEWREPCNWVNSVQNRVSENDCKELNKLTSKQSVCNFAGRIVFSPNLISYWTNSLTKFFSKKRNFLV